MLNYCSYNTLLSYFFHLFSLILKWLLFLLEFSESVRGSLFRREASGEGGEEEQSLNRRSEVHTLLIIWKTWCAWCQWYVETEKIIYFWIIYAVQLVIFHKWSIINLRIYRSYCFNFLIFTFEQIIFPINDYYDLMFYILVDSVIKSLRGLPWLNPSEVCTYVHYIQKNCRLTSLYSIIDKIMLLFQQVSAVPIIILK